MIARIATWMTGVLYENENIGSDEIEIYKYLFEYILENIIYFFYYIIMGIAFGDVFYGVIFFSVICLLRSFGGGVHAPTKRMCNIISYGIVPIVIGGVLLTIEIIPCNFWRIIFAISSCVILFLAPVDCPNKRLSIKQKEKLRQKCMMSLLVIVMIFGAISLFEPQSAYCGIIACGMLVVAVSEWLGVVLYDNKRDENKRDVLFL